MILLFICLSCFLHKFFYKYLPHPCSIIIRNMGICGSQWFIFCILSLATVQLSRAQDSPDDYLAPHNAARAEVGVGPLTWDNGVAAYAQNYANKMAGSCDLVHSGGQYGENLSGSPGDLSVADAVGLWVGEEQFYHYDTNSCEGGECRHYTQVVWRNSVRLVCAKVRCNNGGTFVICSYDPPGNYVGEHPY